MLVRGYHEHPGLEVGPSPATPTQGANQDLRAAVSVSETPPDREQAVLRKRPGGLLGVGVLGSYSHTGSESGT